MQTVPSSNIFILVQLQQSTSFENAPNICKLLGGKYYSDQSMLSKDLKKNTLNF